MRVRLGSLGSMWSCQAKFFIEITWASTLLKSFLALLCSANDKLENLGLKAGRGGFSASSSLSSISSSLSSLLLSSSSSPPESSSVLEFSSFLAFFFFDFSEACSVSEETIR